MKLRSDIPVKYHLHAHRLSSSYPDELDFVFDVVSFIQENNKRKKRWNVEDMKIAMDSIKDIFPDIADEEFKEKIKTIMKYLHINNMWRLLKTLCKLHPRHLPNFISCK